MKSTPASPSPGMQKLKQKKAKKKATRKAKEEVKWETLKAGDAIGAATIDIHLLNEQGQNVQVWRVSQEMLASLLQTGVLNPVNLSAAVPCPASASSSAPAVVQPTAIDSTLIGGQARFLAEFIFNHISNLPTSSSLVFTYSSHVHPTAVLLPFNLLHWPPLVSFDGELTQLAGIPEELDHGPPIPTLPTHYNPLATASPFPAIGLLSSQPLRRLDMSTPPRNRPTEPSPVPAFQTSTPTSSSSHHSPTSKTQVTGSTPLEGHFSFGQGGERDGDEQWGWDGGFDKYDGEYDAEVGERRDVASEAAYGGSGVGEGRVSWSGQEGRSHPFSPQHLPPSPPHLGRRDEPLPSPSATLITRGEIDAKEQLHKAEWRRQTEQRRDERQRRRDQSPQPSATQEEREELETYAQQQRLHRHSSQRLQELGGVARLPRIDDLDDVNPQYTYRSLMHLYVLVACNSTYRMRLCDRGDEGAVPLIRDGQIYWGRPEETPSRRVSGTAGR